jgi:cellobiose phosphorylase
VFGDATSFAVTIAMQSVEDRLVRTADRLILLLDPPFDTSDLNPGYIKGYVPGVRENGGQYTHSAIWTVMARASLGNCDRAWELFSLIDPVSHGATPADIARYRVEPYVVAADVYGVEQPGAGVRLIDDHQDHQVEIEVARGGPLTSVLPIGGTRPGTMR